MLWLGKIIHVYAVVICVLNKGVINNVSKVELTLKKKNLSICYHRARGLVARKRVAQDNLEEGSGLGSQVV